MHLVSINIGQSQAMQIGERSVQTGIYKVSVGQAEVGGLGLAGDYIGDKKHHGGSDQAVYIYSADDYAWWSEQLGFELGPGTFGENLTLSTFGAGPVKVGDHFRIGEVTLEATAPRIPCSTLATRMGDPGFVKKFRAARRPGVYVRVLHAGQVKVGDSVERLPTPHDHPTLREIFELWYDKDPDPARVRWLLEAPIALRARKDWEEWLENRQGSKVESYGAKDQATT